MAGTSGMSHPAWGARQQIAPMLIVFNARNNTVRVDLEYELLFADEEWEAWEKLSKASCRTIYPDRD